MIPARVRSNANWLILYQLNPIDFDTAYRDCVSLPPYQWRDILKFVYGVDISSDKQRRREIKGGEKEEEKEETEIMTVENEIKGKKYENMGIWVEANMYFKNFKRLKL